MIGMPRGTAWPHPFRAVADATPQPADATMTTALRTASSPETGVIVWRSEVLADSPFITVPRAR